MHLRSKQQYCNKLRSKALIFDNQIHHQNIMYWFSLVLLMLASAFMPSEARPSHSPYHSCMDKCKTLYEICDSVVKTIDEQHICFSTQLHCLKDCTVKPPTPLSIQFSKKMLLKNLQRKKKNNKSRFTNGKTVAKN